MSALEFDFESLSKEKRYKLLCGFVAPRPIALVTTITATGMTAVPSRKVRPMRIVEAPAALECLPTLATLLSVSLHHTGDSSAIMLSGKSTQLSQK